MHKQLILGLAAASLVALTGTTALSQSAYFQAVTNLNPVAYYPLQETAQPPGGDVETNLGTLGLVANAVYGNLFATRGFPGAIVSEPSDFSVMFQSGASGYMAVPTTDPRVTVQSGSFTIEAWIYPTNYNSFAGIVSQASPNPGGLNGTTNEGGWVLSANYIAFLDSGNLRGFDFHVYNGNTINSGGSVRGGAEVAVQISYQLNTWYHLVAVFDGTNATLYVNGTNENSAALWNIPMPAGTSYVPNKWAMVQIGASRGLHANPFGGAIDEVAIYTNTLTPVQVANHYQAGTNVAPVTPYEQVIASDSAYMYWRMDAPAYTAADPSTYPAAVNKGSITVQTAYGDSFYGPASQPGVTGPQFSGLLDPNNGNNSYAVAINGIGGNNGGSANVNIGNAGTVVNIAEAVPIDIGLDTLGLLNVTNFTPIAGFSATIWFRSNPSDSDRFQNLFGHSDNGWRTALDAAGKVHFKPGSAGTEITSARVYNDGLWHNLVVTCNGTTEAVYVDGVLDSTAASATSFTGCDDDVILGGDPKYLSGGNENNGGRPVYVLHDGPTGAAADNSGGVNERNLDGRIAHFAFFTNVLSAAQVQTLYAAAGAPPVIMGQPFGPRTNGWAYNGTNTYFFVGVTASGSAPLAYQWFRTNAATGSVQLVDDGVKYVGSTNLQVTISNLVDSDSGTYFVVVTNNYGAVTSSIAYPFGAIQIFNEPYLLGQIPAGGTVSYIVGQAPVYSVSATGSTNNFSYQWVSNGVAIGGAIASSLPLPPLQLINSGVIVQCIVTNSFGSVTSAPVTLSVTAAPTPPANSYAQQILALNPQGYWPMHEAEPPLSNRDIETNYGTLGTLANASYCDWQVIDTGNFSKLIQHQWPGALKNDPDPGVYFGGQGGTPSGGSGAVIPLNSPLETIKPPFTLEAWVKPFNNSFGIILSVGSQTTNSGINGTRQEGGFDWLWAGSPNTFSITMRNGNEGSLPLGSNIQSTEPKTTASYSPNTWYHLVTTYDGTNISYYINGVQDPLQNSSTVGFNPNNWMPLTIGGGRWTGTLNNLFAGVIDELAVYTNLLSTNDIIAHYNDGVSGANGVYKAAVLANNPLLYYRMDSFPYVTQPVSTWPVLTNYGSSGVQGVYKPNAAPGGGPGLSVNGVFAAGFPNTALASDGMSAFADAGYDASFNPTNTTTAPLSVSCWFKFNPADVQQRNWQTLIGHTDQGWRCTVNGGTGAVGFDSGNGLDVRSTATYNDGQWHHVVGTYDGASNTVVYVDGLKAGSGNKSGVNSIQTGFDVYLASSPNGQTNAYGGRTLAGSMCEAAIWNNVCLTSNQVFALYSAAEIQPRITAQPVSGSANQNGGYTNSVAATGSTNLIYHWFKNNLQLPVAGQTNLPFGATNSTLVLYPITTNDQSLNYYAVVTNLYGSATSAVWSINPVFTIPVFTNDIVNTNILLYAGGHAAFSVFALGAQPIGYRWYSNNVPVTAATNTTFKLNNVQPPNATNTFYCVASNFIGTATSQVAVITIIGIPSVIPYQATIMSNNPFGYWPLSEGPDNGAGNDGTNAIDYAGGNNGIYTNVTLAQPGFNPTVDTNGTSVEFGVNSVQDNNVYGIATNVDFSITNGASSNFSVECWAKGFQQTVDAGVITKGFGGGGEQFNLDCGANGGTPTHSYRFFIRDASGGVHAVVSTVNPGDGLWHHLVGVCNETNGQVLLYVDGFPIGTNTFSPGLGVLPSTRHMTIGARPSNSTTNDNDAQFVGWIQDVAVYNYALSAQQVLNDYDAGDIPATIAFDVADETACQNGTAMLNTTVSGTPPVGYQWYDENLGLPIPGATNTTLILASVQGGDSYHLVATNNFGTNQTRSATLTVVSGQPQIFAQPNSQYFVPKGGSITIPVTVLGTLPMTNQWQVSDTNAVTWTNLTDNSRITGSQQIWLNMTNTQISSLTIAAAKLSDAGDYQLATTNDPLGVLGSSLTTIANLIVGTLPITFNDDGVGWTTEQSGTFSSSIMPNPNQLELTDNGGSEARSFFFQYPQYIGAFKAFYTYQAGGSRAADGISFVLQNDPRGATAIGGGGGSLGVSGITPSWDLELNIYSGNSDGIECGIFTNGNVGVNTLGLNVGVGSGDPIDFSLFYLNGRMALTMTDELNTNLTFSTNFVANIQAAVNGQTAYVGFTGATGGSVATQTITNFTFVSLVSENITLSNATNAVITWNGLINGYTLQQNPNLATTNWVNVSSPDSITNGLHQVTVPATSSNLFYRLSSGN